MLATMHWAPYRRAPSVRIEGSRTTALFTLILSAPARRSGPMSSTLRIPPPTVSGTKSTSAVRRTVSSRVPRPSWEAEMSRKQTSSTPSASYRAASSTGSPMSRSPSKFTPFTTRPSFTSRHTITRGRSIRRSPDVGCPRGSAAGGPCCRAVRASQLLLGPLQIHRSLGAEDGVALPGGLSQSESRGLDRGFHHVVPVASAVHHDVQRRTEVVGEALQEVLPQVRGKRALVPRPTTHVDRGADERVVHRHGGGPVALGFRRDLLAEGEPERDRDVLHQVVLHVAGGAERQSEAGVSGEGLDHVGQEDLVRLDVDVATPQVDLDGDLRLLRLPRQPCHANGSGSVGTMSGI